MPSAELLQASWGQCLCTLGPRGGLNENVTHRLSHLNTWSPVSGALGGGGLGGVALLGKVHYEEWALRFPCLSPFHPCSLCFLLVAQIFALGFCFRRCVCGLLPYFPARKNTYYPGAVRQIVLPSIGCLSDGVTSQDEQSRLGQATQLFLVGL